MNLEGKSLCFLDIESTGLDVRHDRIVEITITKINPDGSKDIRKKRFNPQIEINPEATAKHNITNEMVKDEQPFSKYAKSILEFVGDSTIVVYMGMRFDIPMFFYELERSDINWDYLKNNIVDCGQLWSAKETRKLSDAYKHYTGNEVDEDKLHTSEYDTEILMAIFKAQIKKYYEKNSSISEMAFESNYNKNMVDIDGKFYKDDSGVIKYAFGNAKDKPLNEAVWQLEYILKGNYSDNTKKFAGFFFNMINDKK